LSKLARRGSKSSNRTPLTGPCSTQEEEKTAPFAWTFFHGPTRTKKKMIGDFIWNEKPRFDFASGLAYFYFTPRKLPNPPAQHRHQFTPRSGAFMAAFSLLTEGPAGNQRRATFDRLAREGAASQPASQPVAQKRFLARLFARRLLTGIVIPKFSALGIHGARLGPNFEKKKKKKKKTGNFKATEVKSDHCLK